MAYLKADNTMLAVGMVGAAMLVVLVRPASIYQTSTQTNNPQGQGAAPTSLAGGIAQGTGSLLSSIAGFL